MNYKFISDNHVHSDSSLDARDPIIKLCESAVDLKMYSITITDHCDCELYNQKNYSKGVIQSFFSTKKAQFVFKDYLNVFTGIELGQATHNTQAALNALKNSDFDFVLSGIHKLKNSEELSEISYNNENVNNILGKYFDEILNLIDWGNFDSLAHLFYPLRYACKDSDIKLDDKFINSRVDTILESLARKNKALEIDSFMINQPRSSCLSSINILTKFKKLGGNYITFGSNAHDYQSVGNGIKSAMEHASSAGFDHFTIFKNRIPHLFPIC